MRIPCVARRYTWAAFSGAGSVSLDESTVVVGYSWALHSDTDGRGDEELAAAMLDTTAGPLVNVTGGYRAGVYVRRARACVVSRMGSPQLDVCVT